jgi:hypothetical protein
VKGLLPTTAVEYRSPANKVSEQHLVCFFLFMVAETIGHSFYQPFSMIRYTFAIPKIKIEAIEN